jgi:putative DNA primase/helicase
MTSGQSGVATIPPRIGTSTPIDRVLHALEGGGYDPRSVGSQKWEAKCPCHKGSRRNLSITATSDGTVLIRCHHVDDSGQNCPNGAILAELGLTLGDLFTGPPKKTSARKDRGGATFETPLDASEWLARKLKGKVTGRWMYRDSNGVAVLAVYRIETPERKEYRPIGLDPESRLWKIGDPDGPIPLYHLGEIAEADRVYLPEGEKCADLIRGLGLVATTTAHGAQSPHKSDIGPLAGKEVVIVPDHDAPGEGYATKVRDLLGKLDPQPHVRILRLDLPHEGDDIEQWLIARSGVPPGELRNELERLAEALPFENLNSADRNGVCGYDHNGNWRLSPPAPPTNGRPGLVDEAPINRTDLGNARRLVKRFGDTIRHCPQRKAWLAWDGMRWREDGTGEIYRLAKRTVQYIGAEAAETDDDNERKALLRWALESESRKRIDATISLAWSEPGIPVEPADLNSNPWLLNVQNGTIDLRTGKLLPHRRSDLITKLAPVAYDPAAECPKWLAFLERIMEGNQDLIGFLQRAGGYALTGDVSEHALFFLYGTGRNGKGTFLETILALLGDYATTVDTGLITVKRNEDHPTGLTDLDGRRFVSTVEIDDGKRIAEALVKKLTGGDRIKARRMRENNYEFGPTHKIFLTVNHPPEIRGTDEGIWSRVKLIPFNVFISQEERVRNLRETLTHEEGPGILAWLVRGCLEWQRDGLKEPHAVRHATDSYRKSMDAVGGFIAERCKSFLDHPTLKTQARERKDALYHAYVEWAKSNGCEILPARKFGSEMDRRGYLLKASNGRYYRLGLSLNASEDSTPID